MILTILPEVDYFSSCNLRQKENEMFKRIRLFARRFHPSVSGDLIYTGKNVFLPTKTLNLHMTPEIHMKKFKNSTCGVVTYTFVKDSSLFFNLTFFTNFSFFDLQFRKSTNNIF